MPYKDRKKQRESQRRSYLRNREAHIIASNQSRAARRVELNARVRALKDGRPCLDCGVPYPYYVLEFDHVRGEKTGDVSAMVHEAVRWERILEEIEKCDLVCANCHRERTFGRVVPL